jgi:hypothetical protein
MIDSYGTQHKTRPPTRTHPGPGAEQHSPPSEWRRSLHQGEPVTEDMLSVCHQCGSPCNDHTNCRNDACSHLFIQCPSCRETHKGAPEQPSSP